MCVAIDRLRPATSAEALALQFLSDSRDRERGPADVQQNYVDARGPVGPDPAPAEPADPEPHGTADLGDVDLLVAEVMSQGSPQTQ